MSAKVHFLHIGKTGGSAIKEALKRAIKEQDIYANANKLKDNTELEIKRLSGRFDQIILHGHGKTLKQIPESDWFFFCIRNPISRYVSGFYSRKRQGKPRYNIPWNIKEKRAFKHFNTPNELAEALSSDNPKIRRRAKRAMKNIRHVKSSLSKIRILITLQTSDDGRAKSLDCRLSQLVGVLSSSIKFFERKTAFVFAHSSSLIRN